MGFTIAFPENFRLSDTDLGELLLLAGNARTHVLSLYRCVKILKNLWALIPDGDLGSASSACADIASGSWLEQEGRLDGQRWEPDISHVFNILKYILVLLLMTNMYI